MQRATYVTACANGAENLRGKQTKKNQKTNLLKATRKKIFLGVMIIHFLKRRGSKSTKKKKKKDIKGEREWQKRE